MAQQNFEWNFEHRLDGWHATGAAFDHQPVAAANITTDKIPQLVKLKGDYWKNLPYPLGHEGNYLIFTEDALMGTLTSDPFQLSQAKRYFSFLIGGSSDLAHARLELQVLTSSPEDAEQLEKQIRSWANTANIRLPDVLSRDKNFLVAVAATGQYGPGKSVLELLHQEVVPIPDFLSSRTAKLQIVDSSPSAHINVDDIKFGEKRPEPQHAPVWGYGDYHTHPNSHLAFGGTRQGSLLWGCPGRDVSAYDSDPDLITKDIAKCTKNHGRGRTAEPFINQIEERFHVTNDWGLIWAAITGHLLSHKRSGGPEFRNFPSFLHAAHQQMHITQIRRNYDGGLRLLVAYATNNRGAEYLTSEVKAGHVEDPIKDGVTVKAQLDEMKWLVEQNKDWMEIADNPDDARRIIRENKLAVILGVEVDQTGELLSSSTSPEEEIKYLWQQLRVRTVVPIHGSNNRIGGAAVWRNEYNWLNDFIHRKKFDLTVAELQTVDPNFFEVRDGSCKGPGERGECVSFKLDSMQHRLVIEKKILLGTVPFPHEFPWDCYTHYNGHKNVIGLSPDGQTYIDELMKSRMIIDTSHMSDASVKDVYDRVGLRLAKEDPKCAGFSLGSDTQLDPSCYKRAYPIIVSHAHFREQSFYDKETFVERSLPSEYQIGRNNLEAMRLIGGVIGPFVAERPLDLPPNQLKPPFENDCSGSSKGFGLGFRFALQKLDWHGVGMATDFTFIPGTAPRFGKNACWAFNLASDPKNERKKRRSLYDKDAQDKGVVYEGIKRNPRVKYGCNDPLIPYRMGKRKPFDFNVDGLAHFGLVPDMLQDLKNLGLPPKDFEELFSSAEFYLQMWEKAWKNGGPK